MRIGFDAKRAFFNYTGLGSYSRNTIRQLGTRFPEHEYYLYIPKSKNQIDHQLLPNQKPVYPHSWAGRKFSSFWRSCWLSRALKRDQIDLYHGLSNEIPFGIHRHQINSVVTIHDLIFIRYPRWYHPVDREIYIRKSKYACNAATRIIAISEQTRNDIIEFYGIRDERIDVVYQGCDPVFYRQLDRTILDGIQRKYKLPSNYLLYVGTIEHRKNLLQVVKALHRASLQIPLIVIGRPTEYVKTVKKFISLHKMEQIYFLGNLESADLPALYQMADIFLYPSRFEGFGIPILEALCSGTPVITSRGGCLSEAGGKHSVYVNPDDPEELAESIRKILENDQLKKQMSEKGKKHAEKFREEKIASDIMMVYKKIL